jgi:hypothetical protein
MRLWWFNLSRIEKGKNVWTFNTRFKLNQSSVVLANMAHHITLLWMPLVGQINRHKSPATNLDSG